MLRLAHISDLHIRSQNGHPNVRKTAMVLEYALKLGYDHFVITGDIIHYPNPSDYKITRGILNDFGLLKSGKLSMIVGNHEIFGGISFFNEMAEFIKNSSQIDQIRKINEFTDYFPEAFENIRAVLPDTPFPFIKTLDNTALIGINSVDQYSLSRNPFASNGRVSEEQMKALESILNSHSIKGLQKVVLIHHHFSKFSESYPGPRPLRNHRMEWETLKLRGKERLLDLFRKYDVGMVLHGHVHNSMRYNRNGIAISNAGGTLDGPEPNMLTINFIVITSGAINTMIHAFSPNA